MNVVLSSKELNSSKTEYEKERGTQDFRDKVKCLFRITLDHYSILNILKSRDITH